MKNNSQSQGIALLGMHRSGTSTLAGTLRACGVYFGEVLDQKLPRNAKGLNEAASILYMHEDLLVKSGGAWHSPPSDPEWGSVHKAVRNLFIESRQSEPTWAFKDPRTLLVFDGWREALPNIGKAGIFRHPAEVASSIHDRNKFDWEKCFGIWTTYNEKLLTMLKDEPFPVVEFVSDSKKMIKSFETLIRQLGFEMTPEAKAFFDTDLKHFENPDISVPAEAAHLYSELKEYAV
jgi:hypothetical protein